MSNPRNLAVDERIQQMNSKTVVLVSCITVAAAVAPLQPAHAIFGLDTPLGGAATGGLIGAIAGGGKGAAIGALTGAVVGAVVEDNKNKQQ